ncbi:MAG: hypothetical protein RLZZ273_1316 [Bacteroidota bacterium]|jgi:protein involved in polysaccharide export with SLBB domain
MRQPFGVARSVLISAVFVALTYLGYAQGSSGSSLDLDRLGTSASRALGSSSSLLSTDAIPTDDIVDPQIYVLGPGDILAYQTTGLDFTEKLTVVSPECSVMVDRIGLVNVKGLTLAQCRDSLRSIVRHRAPNIEVFVALRRARVVYVTLSGNVTFPGTYAVPASMRVSTFVKLMRQPWLLSKDGGLTELARSANAVTSVPARTPDFMKSSSPFIGPFAMRNTVVRHRKGVSPVDIPKSRVEGYSHLDPHLREGDEVVVPTEDPLMQAISISGAVINPVTLAYKPGDRLSILLAAAGGFSEHADRNRVSLVNSAQGPAQPVLLNEDFSIVGDDIALSPGAAVIVESTTISGERPLGVVSVHGEVSNPGSVVITSGVTKVAEVLQKVGGVRSKAALGLSYIIRPETSPGTQIQQRDEANKLFQYSDLKLEDTTRYNFDQRYRMPYVSTNLAKALADTASLDNVPLQSGDIIVVVPTPERVYVYGQVVRPGYVPFTPGKHLSWYVERAGGFATGAQKGRARIIRGMSKVWMEDDDDIVVEPGDEVYVPRPMDVPVNTEIQTYAVIANIAASIALLATTVMALFR